ncbi:MAG: hypothetical protein HQL66_09480 [Magnetococcales bacterium]|nr:hypothetical protein [Magnetococcales bacterium]
MRLVDRAHRVFACDATPRIGRRAMVVAALSAVEMALGKTTLPFARRDQIRALLPQEAKDLLLTPVDHPCFAMQQEQVAGGSAIFFALCARQKLEGLLTGLSALTVQPIGVVIAELAAWPLLQEAGLLVPRTATLVIDASTLPIAVYTIADTHLLDLRLVAPATAARGEEAIVRELAWLARDLNDRLPHTLDRGRTILLGQPESGWQRQGLDDLVASALVPGLAELGQGLPGWAWLRPAGLALAAARGEHSRLLDFLHDATERAWQKIMQPWRKTFILAACLLLVWDGWEGVRLFQAKTRFDKLKVETDMLFHQALPRIPIVEPRLQLQQALHQQVRAARQEQPGLGTWVARIQTAVPATTQVKWLWLHLDPEGVQLTGEVASYDHLDRVRSALLPVVQGREVRTEEAHIVPETRLVRFRLRLP